MIKFFSILPLLTAVVSQTLFAAVSHDDASNPSYRVQVQKSPSSHEIPQPGVGQSNQKIERTLSILKPDTLKNRNIGKVISRFENAGLQIAAIKIMKFTPDQAAKFYHIHHNRPFFPELVQFMSSGPIIVMVLEGDQAINKNRQLMGATDPKHAEKGTIRADFAESVSHNAVHGSDSPEAAQQEIDFFFLPDQIHSGYSPGSFH